MNNSIKSLTAREPTLIRILHILESYTDDSHLLSREAICKIYQSQYGVAIDTKMVGRHIDYLKKAGYRIVAKQNKGCYLTNRLFTKYDMNLLYDSILINDNIGAKQAKALIKKLKQIEKLAAASIESFPNEIKNKNHFTSKNIYALSKLSDSTSKTELHRKIETLNGVINKKQSVVLTIHDDKTNTESEIKNISPYRIYIYRNRYYLMAIFRTDKQTSYNSGTYICEVKYYALDSIKKIEVTTKAADDLKNIDSYYYASIDEIDEKALKALKGYRKHNAT